MSIRADTWGGMRSAYRGWASGGAGNSSAFTVASLLVALGLGFLALYPTVRVVGGLFIKDGRPSTGIVGRLLDEPDVWELLKNTTLLVLGAGVLAVAGGSVLAWLVVRTDARIPLIGDVLPLLPFLFPAIIGTIGWTVLLAPEIGLLNAYLPGMFNVFGPSGIYSWRGMAFIYAAYMTPFTFLLVSAGLQNMDSQLEEQARVSGAGLFKTLRTVTLPSIRANLGAALLLTIWFGFAFYSGPAILGPRSGIDVLSLRIVNLLVFSFPADTELAVGLSGFMMIAVGMAWYLQTRVLRRARFVTVGGRGQATKIQLGRWRWLGQLVLGFYVMVALILPALALLWVALRGYWSSNLTLDGLNLEQFRQVIFRDPLTSRSLATSVRLGLTAATIGMLAAAVIARYVQTSSSQTGRLIDVLVKITAPVPSVVLAVGFVLTLAGPPFNLNGTFLILLLAYLAHFLPQATTSADAAAAQVGHHLTEASHIAGAGDGRTFFRISLPLMLPGLIAGWGLLFLWVLGELNASVILASIGNPVIGYQILSLYTQGFFGRLAGLAIVMLAINLVVLTTVGYLGRRFHVGKAISPNV